MFKCQFGRHPWGAAERTDAEFFALQVINVFDLRPADDVIGKLGVEGSQHLERQSFRGGIQQRRAADEAKMDIAGSQPGACGRAAAHENNLGLQAVFAIKPLDASDLELGRIGIDRAISNDQPRLSGVRRWQR